ncbi:MAG: threonine synthase [Vicingus serpentipes]|nr:threonine synthase [Vicingus serpentipes]
MKYNCTRNNNEQVSFKEAVIKGLTEQGGLYIPEQIPTLPSSFFEQMETMDDQAIAFQVLAPFVADSLNDEQLKQVIAETLVFPTPVVPVTENVGALELFHGPTQAFKDVGARFMSRCLSHFYDGKEVIILVATSGDTGSAVASGFYNVPGVTVKILFPKGKVSPYQEYQMTSLGKNIHVIEVDGTFDDCQALVKQAFNDEKLRKELAISSANSINIARLLPQMLYYFFAYKQLKTQLGNKKLVVSVPCGNLGNLTAGIIAKKMGLPIERFVAANNANDTFYNYLNTGEYHPKSSVLTYSNAMDVGAPSNFERLQYIYNDNLEAIKKDISSFRYDDDATLQEIEDCKNKNNYLLDPHGAVGKLALEASLNANEYGVFLETAHPQKFSEVIQKVIPNYESEAVDLSNCSKESMNNNYKELLQQLTVKAE